MDLTETVSMIGLPARVIGRMPVFARYIFGHGVTSKRLNDYCLERFGKSHRLRPWLLFDAGELMLIEILLNERSDKELLTFRTAQLANSASTTVVGSLLASACVTMLSMDGLSEVNLTVRVLFIISLMLSLLAVYFALVQQRELSLGTSAEIVRLWLWNGRTRTTSQSHYSSTAASEGPSKSEDRAHEERVVQESSLASNIILQAPYELLSIAISVFLGGLIAYLASAWVEKVKLGAGPWPTNAGMLIIVSIFTVFTLLMFGQALGQKDKEMARSRAWPEGEQE